jgi:glutathione S-transferase
MTTPTLYIGDKNLSSWSLRPWLFMKVRALPFEEKLLRLDTEAFRTAIASVSPTAKVPVLVDGPLVVWESLAICEHVAEGLPTGRAWPEHPVQRGMARALAHEMHAGFAALRRECPMHCAERLPTPDLSPAAQHDIVRVIAAWTLAREANAELGPFLFGEFGIVDAMYAPVVTRLRTYGITVPDVVEQYMASVEALPAMQAWVADARDEVAARRA